MLIDAHVHCFPPSIVADRAQWFADEPYFAALYANPKAKLWDIDSLLRAMDDAGVDHVVTVNFGWRTLERSRYTNDYLLNGAARHATRLSAFVMAPPTAGDATLRELARCAAGGARGFGEYMPDGQEFSVEDAALVSETMDLARASGLCALFHASEPVGHTYPGKGTMTPDKLLRLASAFPDNRFIFAHCGGGLPFYALMPEVRAATRNVWYDTAATPYLYDPTVYRAIIDSAGADRLLFASDAPLLTFRRCLRHLAAGGLCLDEWRAVTGANAAALLNLAGRSNDVAR